MHGLADTEIRYRQRYLDLMANEEVRKLFLKRSEIVREVRSFLHSRGFMEVETPMMQAIPGRGRPAVCHASQRPGLQFLPAHRPGTLPQTTPGRRTGAGLRSRPQFPQRRPLRKHNPEFTMLEAYQAYGDYETMMELVQSLVCHVAEKVFGSLTVEHRDAEGQIIRTIRLNPPWTRIKYKDLVRERAGRTGST